MMHDYHFYGMGWMHVIGILILALVIAALIKYVFFR